MKTDWSHRFNVETMPFYVVEFLYGRKNEFYIRGQHLASSQTLLSSWRRVESMCHVNSPRILSCDPPSFRQVWAFRARYVSWTLVSSVSVKVFLSERHGSVRCTCNDFYDPMGRRSDRRNNFTTFRPQGPEPRVIRLWYFYLLICYCSLHLHV